MRPVAPKDSIRLVVSRCFCQSNIFTWMSLRVASRLDGRAYAESLRTGSRSNPLGIQRFLLKPVRLLAEDAIQNQVSQAPNPSNLPSRSSPAALGVRLLRRFPFVKSKEGGLQ